MDVNRQRQEEQRIKRRKANRRNINLSYVIVMAIVIVGLFADYIILQDLNEFSWQGFISDIVGNLMGVMGAFVVFDIIHDKLSKDSYADEVSEQILDTLLRQDGIEALDEDIKRKFVRASLMSLDRDKEAAEEINKSLEEYLSEIADRYYVLDRIDEFSDKQKDMFVRENVASILKDDTASDMILDYLDSYLKKDNNLRFRTNFSYEFILSATLPEEYDVLKHKEEYYLVHEMLSYEVKFLTEEMNNLKPRNGIVCLGFPYDNSALDKFLRDSIPNQQQDEELGNCVFRESLSLNEEDREYFMNLPADELKNIFKKMFKPHLSINGNSGELEKVEAYPYGIIAKFRMDNNSIVEPESGIYNVDIVFYMPKKWQGVLEVALVDPTKNPRISIDYPEDLMYVDMYSFLNKSDETSYDNTHIEDNGMYRIILNNKWVFPVSGIMFVIGKKEKNKLEK
jgi:hypothetical protein